MGIIGSYIIYLKFKKLLVFIILYFLFCLHCVLCSYYLIMLDCSKSCFKILKNINTRFIFYYKAHLLNMWSTRSFLYAPSLTGSSPWLRVSFSLPAPSATGTLTTTHAPSLCLLMPPAAAGCLRSAAASGVASSASASSVWWVHDIKS